MNWGHSAKKLPNPWLFDSHVLFRELTKVREAILRIAPNENTLSDINAALDRIWRLENNMKFLLDLHAQGQRAFQQKAEPPAEIQRVLSETNNRLKVLNGKSPE
ncbi:MAG: hypothetical protein ACJ8IQ_02680 [Chthoniobacterales bacterium]